MKKFSNCLLATLVVCLIAPPSVAISSSLPQDLPQYHHRKLRASEVLFNVGFLYLAEGMNHVHDDDNEKLAGATLERGFTLMRLARQHNAEASVLSRDHGLAYSQPRVDKKILEGTPPPREQLEKLAKNFKISSLGFAGTMLDATLGSQDLLVPVAEVVRNANGEDGEKLLKRALDRAAQDSNADKKKRLKESELAELAEEYGLNADEISVLAEGDAPIWDSPRAGTSQSSPATPPVAANFTGSSLPQSATAAKSAVQTKGDTRSHSVGNQELRDSELIVDKNLREVEANTEIPTARDKGNVATSKNARKVIPAEKAQAIVQRAAEAAALAGARVKAEQIALVAALNWEMRRALKEFLYAYTVHNQAPTSPCFPLDATGKSLEMCLKRESSARYDFALMDPREQSQETNGPFLPAVCTTFEATNNYCQKAGIPGIPFFQGGANWGVADPISAVKPATGKLDRRAGTCLGRTEVNQYILMRMLFGMEAGTNEQSFPYQGRIGNDRLGILPRLALLNSRVKTIDHWLGLDFGRALTISDLKGSRLREPAHARSKAALEAAREVLEAAGLGTEKLELQETPVSKAQRLHYHYVNISVASMQFQSKSESDNGNCFLSRDVRRIPLLPYGIIALPGLYENYQVKLSVQIKKAAHQTTVAAAPSKINVGPGDSDELEDKVTPAKASREELLNTLASPRLLNLLIAEDDKNSKTGGFTRIDHLGYLRGASMAFDSQTKGYRLAGALSPWELSRYAPPCKYTNGSYKVAVALSKHDLGARLRNQIAGYLGMRDANSPVLKNWIPDKAGDRLSVHLGYHMVPDPLLREDADLSKYAQTFGKNFTTAGQQDGVQKFDNAAKASGVCNPGSSIVK